MREALRALEQEGQVMYRPWRGYCGYQACYKLRADDLTEIYELRQVPEERAARRTPPTLDEEALQRIAAKLDADLRSRVGVARPVHAIRLTR